MRLVNFRALAAFFSLVVTVGVAGSASAWRQSKVPRGEACLAWQPRELSWSPASPLGGGLDRDEAMRTIRRSFDVWQGPNCSDLSFVEEEEGEREVGFRRGGSNRNVILFRDDRCDQIPANDPCHWEKSCSEVYDCWDFDERLIAVTTVTFSRCSGEIFDADIEFNAASFRFTTADGPKCTSEMETDCVAMDLQNTLVHEIGHMIGLDHSPRKTATMYAAASMGETIKRDLSPDDEAAVCAIYPVGERTRTCGGVFGSTDCTEMRRHHSSSPVGCTAAGGSRGGWPLMVLGALVWGWGRSRRHRA